MNKFEIGLGIAIWMFFIFYIIYKAPIIREYEEDKVDNYDNNHTENMD